MLRPSPRMSSKGDLTVRTATSLSRFFWATQTSTFLGKNLRILFAGIVCLCSTSLSGLVFSPPAQAQSLSEDLCPYSQLIAPAETTRIFRSNQLGFSFQMPDNYRAMGWGDRNIQILDPAGYEEMQCLLSNQIGTDNLPASIRLFVESFEGGDRAVIDRVAQYSPLETIQQTTVGSQNAVAYVLDGPMGETKNVSFLTPDRQSMITISADYGYVENEEGKWVRDRLINEGVFEQVLFTFAFN